MNPLWLRAPVRLAGLPAVLAAVTAAAAILAVVVTAGPAFLSSAGNQNLETRLDRAGPYGSGLTFEMQGSMTQSQPARDFAAATQELDRSVGRLEAFSSRPDITLTIPPRAIGGRGYSTTTVQTRLFYRPGALDHIHITSGKVSNPGVWIARSVAARTGLRPRDTFQLAFGDRVARAPVAGIYEDLKSPLDPYWKTIEYQIVQPIPFQPAPPPFTITTRPLFFRIGHSLRDSATVQWAYPRVDSPLTVGEANVVAQRVRNLQGAVTDETTTVGETLSRIATIVGLVHTTSTFPDIAAEATQTVTAISPSVELLSGAGTIVALAVMAAACVFGTRRRAGESRLLLSQGLAPWNQGILYVVESAPALAVGTVAGWGMTVLVVQRLGPSSFLGPGVAADGLRRAAVGMAVAAVVLGVTAAIVVHRSERLDRVPGRGGRFYWELIVLGLAGAAFYELVSSDTALVAGAGAAPHPDLFVLAFPILFVTGIVGLAARAMRKGLPSLGRYARNAPVPLYLAGRRLGAAAGVGLLLMTVSAIAIGVLVYAATLVSSTSETIDAKARVATGSATSVTVAQGDLPTGQPPFPLTRVAVAQATLQPTEEIVNVLGVDPSSFASAAYWGPNLSDESLDDVLAQLSHPRGNKLPVLVAGTGGQVTGLRWLTRITPVGVIDRATGFPGMVAGTPLVVADRHLLERSYDRLVGGPLPAVDHLWSPAPHDEVVAWLSHHGVTVLGSNSSAAFAAKTNLRPVTWTFSLLQALGILAGAVAVLGLLFYLESRQRATEISYGLARRMGLTKPTHRKAVLIELGGMLLLSLLLGCIAALVAAVMVHGRLDPIPELPPTPLFALPVPVLVALLPALSVVAILGARKVQRSADEANMAEVLRDAG